MTSPGTAKDKIVTSSNTTGAGKRIFDDFLVAFALCPSTYFHTINSHGFAHTSSPRQLQHHLLRCRAYAPHPGVTRPEAVRDQQCAGVKNNFTSIVREGRISGSADRCHCNESFTCPGELRKRPCNREERNNFYKCNARVTPSLQDANCQPYGAIKACDWNPNFGITKFLIIFRIFRTDEVVQYLRGLSKNKRLCGIHCELLSFNSYPESFCFDLVEPIVFLQ